MFFFFLFFHSLILSNYVTARRLKTSLVPYNCRRVFELSRRHRARGVRSPPKLLTSNTFFRSYQNRETITCSVFTSPTTTRFGSSRRPELQLLCRPRVNVTQNGKRPPRKFCMVVTYPLLAKFISIDGDQSFFFFILPFLFYTIGP